MARPFHTTASAQFGKDRADDTQSLILDIKAQMRRLAGTVAQLERHNADTRTRFETGRYDDISFGELRAQPVPISALIQHRQHTK